MATEIELARVMAFLGAAVGKEPSPQMVEAYYAVVGHWPAATLQAAAVRALAESQYPTVPPVGVLARHCGEIARPPLPVADGYGMAMRVVRAWGPWLLDRPTHEPTLRRMQAAVDAIPASVRKAAEIYGWQTLCDTPASIASPQFNAMVESRERQERQAAALPPQRPAAALKSPMALNGKTP